MMERGQPQGVIQTIMLIISQLLTSKQRSVRVGSVIMVLNSVNRTCADTAGHRQTRMQRPLLVNIDLLICPIS